MQEQCDKHKKLQRLKKALNVKGYLFKKSKSIISKYRKRFFMIMGDALAYFTDDQLKDFRKQFNFKQIQDLKKVGDIVFSFCYHFNEKESKQYLFKAQSTDIRNNWVKCLEIVLQDQRASKQLTKSMEIQRPRVILKKYSEEMEMQSDIKFVFQKLKLPLLQYKYNQDYIQSRVARHFNGKQVLFLVSCKSLDKELFDDSILSKEHMGKFDFNILYKYNIQTREYFQVAKAEEIQHLSLQGNILKINHYKENVSLSNSSIYTFMEKLKRSIEIGAEYRNKQGISLKQNVDYLIDLFDKPQSKLRQQHLQIKLQDEFINLKINNKNYKQSYEQFKEFSNLLIDKVQGMLNALKLKNRDLLQLSYIVLRFYQQKIYKLLRTFWTQNSQTMTVDDLIAMTIISIRFLGVISQYDVDRNKTMMGIKFLRDTYLKKIITTVELQIKELMKNECLFVNKNKNGESDLPEIFIDILNSKIRILSETQCNHHVIKQSKQLLLEAIVIVLTNQLETKIVLNNYDQYLLILECNNTWRYEELLENEMAEFDLIEVNNSLIKIRKLLIKKIFSKGYSEKKIPNQQHIITSSYFLDMSVENYYSVMNNLILKLRNMSPKTQQEIKLRLSDDFNNYYLKSLVNAADKETIFINVLAEIISKIEADQKNIQLIFPQDNLERINSFFNCIKPIFDDKDTKEKVKDRFMELKFNIFPDDFRKSDYKSLLSLKGTFDDLDALIIELDSAVVDFDMDERTTESDNDVSFRSLTGSLSGSNIRLRKQTSHKRQAHILINDDIDMEGYLKKRIICSSQTIKSEQQFVDQYFKLNSQYILWYKNSNSQDLLGRIMLGDIKKVDVSTTNSEQFYITLNNGLLYEFKTGSSCFASKWVQKINISNLHSPMVKAQSLKNLLVNEKLSNLFESDQDNKLFRPSMLSNHRDNLHSRLIDYDSSESPIIKKQQKQKKKKFSFGKLFSCVSEE